MSKAADYLREWHDALNANDEQTGNCLAEELAELEEVRFMLDGTPRSDLDLAGVAREMADVVWTIYGDALALGIDVDKALAEVYRANMEKLTAPGGPRMREDGKVLKPLGGWQPPNMAKAIL